MQEDMTMIPAELDELETLAKATGPGALTRFCDALDPLFPEIVRRARLTLAPTAQRKREREIAAERDALRETVARMQYEEDKYERARDIITRAASLLQKEGAIVDRVEAWRVKQPNPLGNAESIRVLIERSLDGTDFAEGHRAGLEEAAKVANDRAEAIQRNSRGGLGTMFADQAAEDFRGLAKALRALAAPQKEPGQ